jgi:protein phosphatase
MLASETIRTAFERFRSPLLSAVDLDLGRSLPASGELLIKGIRLANRAIFNMALMDNDKLGMGTTVVAVAFEADIMSIAHVGDSRAYRLEKNRLEPLTKDHSWLQEFQQTQHISKDEAGALVGKNVITRALGVRESVEVDYRIVKIQPGDMFIMCSDGLCGFADDDEIFDAARGSREDINRMAGDLVQMANDRGGADNVTVIIIEVLETQNSPLPELDVFTQPAESEEHLKAEDEWLEKLDQYQVEHESEVVEEATEPGSNRLVLLGIIVVFVIIACLIIYFSQDL